MRIIKGVMIGGLLFCCVVGGTVFAFADWNGNGAKTQNARVMINKVDDQDGWQRDASSVHLNRSKSNNGIFSRSGNNKDRQTDSSLPASGVDGQGGGQSDASGCDRYDYACRVHLKRSKSNNGISSGGRNDKGSQTDSSLPASDAEWWKW